MIELRWTLVVPLKPADVGKSRLAESLDSSLRLALVEAMVADTLAAAAGARLVDRIVIVTGDDAIAVVARRVAVGALVDIVAEPDPAGLNPAVRAGVARARLLDPAHGVGVLLGDLPALRSRDLDDALGQAAGHPRATVADAQGTGTTLITARPGVRLDPAFGPGSAERHASGGHVSLNVPAGSGLSHDVDVLADLEVAIRIGVGARTRSALARI